MTLFCNTVQLEKQTQHSGQSWEHPISTEEVQTQGKKDAPKVIFK